ncbi:hypothetical protein LINPERHAP1_LOCUS30477, partial [Linum perenne]
RRRQGSPEKKRNLTVIFQKFRDISDNFEKIWGAFVNFLKF